MVSTWFALDNGCKHLPNNQLSIPLDSCLKISQCEAFKQRIPPQECQISGNLAETADRNVLIWLATIHSTVNQVLELANRRYSCTSRTQLLFIPSHHVKLTTIVLPCCNNIQTESSSRLLKNQCICSKMWKKWMLLGFLLVFCDADSKVDVDYCPESCHCKVNEIDCSGSNFTDVFSSVLNHNSTVLVTKL